MKTKLFALLFLTSLTGFSQSFEKLKSETKKIYDGNYTMDFEMVANLTYPKIYEEKGRTTFIDKLDTDYQNDEYRMRLELETVIFLYSEMKKAAGKNFYIITYKNPTRFFFENKLDAATAAVKASALKENTQSNDVTFEPKRNSFNVRRNSKFIAVSDESTNLEWKFFNMDDPFQRKAFETIFNTDVKKELGL
ncbi:MAG TPA: hypothetical protein VK476_06520 [Flavobacterium sp.]|nr:hypothetical protein [Flavobacterium sp.]